MKNVFPPPADILPHTGRSVLIDEVLSDSEDQIEVVACITPEHAYFVAGKGVPAWVGIEIMAQAVAAHSGLVAFQASGGGQPRRGMLLGTRRYESQVAWFENGSRLIVRAVREFGGNGGMGACACVIECDGKPWATATILLVEEEDE